MKLRLANLMIAVISLAQLHDKKINMGNHRTKSINKQMTSKAITSIIPNQNPNTRKLT